MNSLWKRNKKEDLFLPCLDELMCSWWAMSAGGVLASADLQRSERDRENWTISVVARTVLLPKVCSTSLFISVDPRSSTHEKLLHSLYCIQLFGFSVEIVKNPFSDRIYREPISDCGCRCLIKERRAPKYLFVYSVEQVSVCSDSDCLLPCWSCATLCRVDGNKIFMTAVPQSFCVSPTPTLGLATFSGLNITSLI